jgi:multicomponent Na+:H+ antiporter subunit F
MSADLFLFVSENVALGLLSLALVIVLVRLFRGPTLPDRILALDMLTTLAISLIGVLTLRTGVDLLLDIALALCLVGFVATVALARYALVRKSIQSVPVSTGGST